MILVNLKAHRTDANWPKGSSSASIDFENEPPQKKPYSMTCYFGGTTKILVPKKSFEAVKPKSSHIQLNASTSEGW